MTVQVEENSICTFFYFLEVGHGKVESNQNYCITHNEDACLTIKRSMVEFQTTIRYIEKYLESGMRILEIGIGIGQ